VDAETIQRHRHNLFLPDDADGMVNPVLIDMSDTQQETALRIAQISADVLCGRMRQSGLDIIHHLHRSNAAAHGLIRPNGRIRVKDLEEVIGNYCNSMPSNVEFSVVRNRLSEWSLKGLRKPRGAVVHPMVHIILMDCFRPVQERDFLFCANARPIADTSERPSQRKVIDHSDLVAKMSSPGATLSGIARLTGISITTVAIDATRAGIKVPRRPKYITDERLNEVKTSFRLGLSIDDVALKHAISVVSAYRILRMDTALTTEYQEKLFSSMRAKYRQRFIDARTDKAAYVWLRRHDLHWLTGELAIHPKTQSRKNSVDWRQRDEALANLIAASAVQLREMSDRPTFISETRLKRLTSMANIIDRNLSKLPLTQVALKSCAESASAHQRRRIIWAYHELRKAPDFLCRKWEVLRLAGVRKLFLSNEAFVASLI
jgi:hypothetical protein